VFALTAYFLWFNNTSVVSDTITQKDSKEDFTSGDNFLKKTKILIVPGHDSDDYGARFNDLKEEELNLELAENLFKLLSKEDSFEVFITRDKNGYKETFDEYFKQEEKINNFIYENKIETKNKTNSGQFEPVNVVEHNLVGEDIALKLYGINKWSNENNIDLILHIHFNNYPRKDMKKTGKYNGFSIYIPSQNMIGYFESKIFAQKLRANLNNYFKESNLPVEKDIIIENSDLIAVGSNKTIKNSIPVLVEYGYIYEPLFYDKEKRNINLSKAAYQTYISIRDLFLN
jgi:N-acetylmuramoyl-L-alanine amidase